jgi:ABC-type transporter Mla maintaining outer membrane lipid asymmetry ATPase subunit MlaF
VDGRARSDEGLAMSALVEVKNFKKSFGDKVVHKNVSFDLNQGEIDCLMLSLHCSQQQKHFL